MTAPYVLLAAWVLSCAIGAWRSYARLESAIARMEGER
jgi:hypothetical protein